MQKFVREHSHDFKEWPDQRSHWQKFPGPKFISEQQKTAKLMKACSQNRKDFSGIFKNIEKRADNNINPFVVLSPLAMQDADGVSSDDNSKEELLEEDNDKKEQVEPPPVKQEES